MKRPAPKTLHRYTNLAATIHMLRSRTITLLNPGTWDDRNDAYFMAEYKRLQKLTTLLALCFADVEETYHHWRVFSYGTDGARIEFDRDRLLAAVASDRRVTARAVQYRKIRELNDDVALNLDDLPFLKRDPFRHENEFRIIYADRRVTSASRDVAIDIGCIRRITLSPWMARPLATSVIASLKEIDGCESLKIYRSTLIDNEKWQSLASNAR
jgi:hypothetical protein